MADVYPQLFRMRLSESAASTITDKQYFTPVITGPGSFFIMNIIRVFGWMDLSDGAQLVTVKQTGGTMQLQKDQGGALQNPDNDNVVIDMNLKAQTLTSGAISWQTPFVQDFSDGEGHGILLAEKSVYFNVQGDGDNAGPIACNMWLLYNMVKVGASELLDMLQED